MKDLLICITIGLLLFIVFVIVFSPYPVEKKAVEDKPEINIPAGQEVIGITYANGKLLYLTRPMAEDYVPQTKLIVEKTRNGVVESSIVIIESR